MKKDYLECGRVLAAHGVRGVLKIEHWCDNARVLSSQKRVFIKRGDEYTEYAVINASPSGEYVLMSLEGVCSRDEAQGMKNTVLYLRREDVPIAEGAIFVADMIGLPLIDIDTGCALGEISEVKDGVQGKLYTVITQKGEVIFPGIPEFVKEIDVERGVFVRTIPGFFD